MATIVRRMPADMSDATAGESSADVAQTPLTPPQQNSDEEVFCIVRATLAQKGLGARWQSVVRNVR